MNAQKSRQVARKNTTLAEYEAKRDFAQTPEPEPLRAAGRGDRFVVQRHWARREHFDFRLELDGVLKSWAVTRGPSARPGDKRLAVRTEDHPLSYADFEGVIPAKQYGAGTVMLWDRGTWRSVDPDPEEAIARGSLKFELFGERMRGQWALVRLDGDGRRENWLLLKHRDGFAEADDGLATRHPTSITTGRDEAEIAANLPARGAARKPARNWPAFLPPQLCGTAAKPPEGHEWLHEIKYDGYRLQVMVSRGQCRYFTRSGLDWTKRFRAIAAAAAQLKVEDAVIDGEAVVFDANGISDFPALVAALESGMGHPVLQAFDLLRLDRKDLAAKPLLARKILLKQLLAGAPAALRNSDHIEGHGSKVLSKALAAGAEGIISKKASAPYRSGRSTSWLKIKGARRTDAVIVGWTPSERGRPFASLLLAVRLDGRLHYSGGVGTGFSSARQTEIMGLLKPLKRETPVPELENAALAPRSARWVEPLFEAELAIAGWTKDRQVRQARFLALKPALQEAGRAKGRPHATAASAASRRAPPRAPEEKMRITHSSRVIFPDAGVTKGAIAAYYESVADRMLPHLEDRLISVVRAPDGIEQEQFFQRHPMKGMGAGIEPLDVGAKTYFSIKGRTGLLTLAQFGTIELHGWGSRRDALGNPDRVIFDLDPADDVPFAVVTATAMRMRSLLEAARLPTFPLVSGGKGVHVVIPLDRSQTWPDIEQFSKGFAEALVRTAPTTLIAVASKARRAGKIYIDYLRNKLKATAIVPYSLRARSLAPVAMPVTWEELPTVTRANQFSMSEALERGAAWPGFEKARTAIAAETIALLAG